MNLYQLRLLAGRLIFNYVCVVITYTLARIPIAILVLTFAQGRHPQTLAWAMRYPDQVFYLPFILVLDGLEGFENTDLFGYIVIGYFSTAVILLLVIGIVATFKGVRRFFEIMGS